MFQKCLSSNIITENILWSHRGRIYCIFIAFSPLGFGSNITLEHCSKGKIAIKCKAMQINKEAGVKNLKFNI